MSGSCIKQAPKGTSNTSAIESSGSVTQISWGELALDILFCIFSDLMKFKKEITRKDEK